MAALAKYLQILFNDIFGDTFSMFSVMGHSGRSATAIRKREEIVTDDILFQSNISKKNQSVLEISDVF
jgi:hypothetical protein